MNRIGHFTLPVGSVPEDALDISISVFQEQVDAVLSTMDVEGQYQLYQCVDVNGVPTNIVPVCRVSKPLLVSVPTVYLDTSAVSYLVQEDAPLEMAQTLSFWEAARVHKVMLYLSDVTLEELMRCPEPKRTKMFDLLGEVSYTLITAIGCPEIDALVLNIEAMGILPKKSVADAHHIAAAIHARCDVIASWNFKHLTRRATIDSVRTLALGSKCGSIDICSPATILEVYL